MKSYSAERMRGLDRRTIDEYGIPGVTLMENAGSGDTLTGLCGSFLAQGYSGFDAARLAVFIHGYAGELLSPCGSRGVIADDLASACARAMHRILPVV